MESIRRKTHRKTLYAFGSRRADLPLTQIGACGVGLGGKKFEAQEERFILQKSLAQSEVNYPAPQIARRNNLLPGDDLFAQLISELLVLFRGELVLRDCLPESRVGDCVDIGLGFPERAARHENLVAQDLLLPGRQSAGPPFQQHKHAGSRHQQQRRIQRHQSEPFAQPDLPASDRLNGNDLHLGLFDVARERAASQPERRETEERGNDAQRVSEENLRKSPRSAVIFDQQWEPDHADQEKRSHHPEEPKTKSRFPG